MESLEYEFEELSLLNEGPIELSVTAAGKAEINYSLDGEWHIKRIYLKQYDRKKMKWSDVPYELSTDGNENYIWRLILSRLMDSNHFDNIDEAVAEARHEILPWPSHASLTAAE